MERPSRSFVLVGVPSDRNYSFEGNRFSHASPFARIMEDGLARRLVQIGIRAVMLG